MVHVFPRDVVNVGRTLRRVQNLAYSDFFPRRTSMEPSSISSERILMIELDESDLIEAIWYVRSRRTPCNISLSTACATTVIVPAFTG
jgi:hypothetical protein